MKQQEINEGNELIAEFMKLKESPVHIQEYAQEKNGKLYILQDSTHQYLQYHKSFDWLMPVVEKLYKMDETDVKGYDTFNDDYLDDIRESFFDINISGTYETVVNTIKWFNENK